MVAGGGDVHKPCDGESQGYLQAAGGQGMRVLVLSPDVRRAVVGFVRASCDESLSLYLYQLSLPQTSFPPCDLQIILLKDCIVFRAADFQPSGHDSSCLMES